MQIYSLCGCDGYKNYFLFSIGFSISRHEMMAKNMVSDMVGRRAIYFAYASRNAQLLRRTLSMVS